MLTKGALESIVKTELSLSCGSRTPVNLELESIVKTELSLSVTPFNSSTIPLESIVKTELSLSSPILAKTGLCLRVL